MKAACWFFSKLQLSWQRNIQQQLPQRVSLIFSEYPELNLEEKYVVGDRPSKLGLGFRGSFPLVWA